MEKTNSTICDSITKLNQESQNQRLRFFAKIDISTKLKILQRQKTVFHKLKNIYSDVDNSLLTLSSLILAIDEVTQEFDKVNFNVIKLRAKNNKIKIKRQKVLAYWAIVRTLKLEEKMSFRDISDYLKKYHKFEVSYSLIYEIWNEIENNLNTKENEKC